MRNRIVTSLLMRLLCQSAEYKMKRATLHFTTSAKWKVLLLLFFFFQVFVFQHTTVRWRKMLCTTGFKKSDKKRMIPNKVLIHLGKDKDSFSFVVFFFTDF